MTSTGFPTLTTRTSYWQVSRAPRYSLLFAIPLLVFYQVLALLLAHGERSIRNGADVILQALFTAAAGAWGPPLFMVCLIGGGLWLVTRDMRAHGSRLRGGVFAAMLGESIALALIFGFVVGNVTSGVLGMLQTLALPGGAAHEQDAEPELLVDPRSQREHQPGPPVHLVACPTGEGEGLQHAEHPRGHVPHHEAEDQRERDRLAQHRGKHAAPEPRSVGAHVARDEPQPPADQANHEERRAPRARRRGEQGLQDHVRAVADRALAVREQQREYLVKHQQRDRKQQTVARGAAHLPIGGPRGESRETGARHRVMNLARVIPGLRARARRVCVLKDALAPSAPS